MFTHLFIYLFIYIFIYFTTGKNLTKKWTRTPRGILSAGWHRFWFATHFLGNKDEFTVNFRGSAISHEKQVMGDLLQYATEFNM